MFFCFVFFRKEEMYFFTKENFLEDSFYWRKRGGVWCVFTMVAIKVDVKSMND